MLIQSRQLTIDLYNCNEQIIADTAGLKKSIENVLETGGARVLESVLVNQDDYPDSSDNHTTMLFVIPNGHLSIHIQTNLRYAALDLFLLAADADPDILAERVKSLFKPDKTKSTHLRRGDLSRPRDIKPKTTTRVAPFRKIKSTGAKVIRILARRKR